MYLLFQFDILIFEMLCVGTPKEREAAHVKNVTLLIKPASSLCNLRCRYCFYADVSDNRAVKSMGVMSHETAGELIEAAFAAADSHGTIGFAFQGGEPTMAGLDFFRDFTAMVSARRPLDRQVSYSLQTNGMVLDGEWAHFLKENNFLVGISVDGYRELHDYYRVDPQGKGTYGRAVKSLALLQKYGVETNLLCVVTGQCAKHPQKAYASLKKLGVRYLQFIPCLDPLEAGRGHAAYSLTPKLYGDFLCGLFDLWYRDWAEGHYISVRLFDDYVHLAMGEPPSTCATSGGCGSYFVVEGDGSIYPCDFYVLDGWRMGDVHTDSLEKLANAEIASEFLRQGRRRPSRCESCRWVSLCQGGCRRDWRIGAEETENYYCESFRRFFEYAAERLNGIARQERRNRMR